DMDLWSFTANKGDSISVTLDIVSGNDFFSPIVYLYRPDGTRLFSSGNPPSGTISNTAPSLGTYTVLIASGQPGGTGAYRVRLDKVPPDLSNVLPLATTVTNRFASSGDRAYYVVNVPPGGHLQLTLQELDHLGVNEIYIRQGAFPSPGSY